MYYHSSREGSVEAHLDLPVPRLAVYCRSRGILCVMAFLSLRLYGNADEWCGETKLVFRRHLFMEAAPSSATAA